MNSYVILIIVILIVLLIVYIKYRKPKEDTLIMFSGTNGGGKSFNMTSDSRKKLFKARSKWKRINYPFFTKPLDLIPYFKKKRLNNEYYGLKKPNLYSSYPIIISKKELSLPITNDIMFLKETIPLGSQVVIDEFSGWISQFEFKENFSEVLNDHLQKWRHYHGNDSHFYCADQCSNNIPIQVRYRCNKVIVCKKTKHYFKFIHITEYKCLDLSDDIKSVEIIDDSKSDTDDNVLKMVRFSLGRKYDDRAYSNRYYYIDGNDYNCKYINSKLKVDGTLIKPDKKIKYKSIDDIINEKSTIDIKS